MNHNQSPSKKNRGSVDKMEVDVTSENRYNSKSISLERGAVNIPAHVIASKSKEKVRTAKKQRMARKNSLSTYSNANSKYNISQLKITNFI